MLLLWHKEISAPGGSLRVACRRHSCHAGLPSLCLAQLRALGCLRLRKRLHTIATLSTYSSDRLFKRHKSRL